ncbi:CerR family C-terminal domain-containing protein [Sphingomonas sp.]|uniref:CerR family C-terminal domain-containing protein n=1 Tax=Sphingomonas sp. TaxID=28214 RepID=UPI0035BBBF6D
MTPSRLLDIAIREFGAKGLEGASTRGIAAAAGTAMSAITYHYGGKEGLYLAAADRIAALIAERMRDGLAIEAVIDEGDTGGARDGVVRVLMQLADTMASVESEEWAPFIVREQMHPTVAFERLHAGAMGTMLATLARLVGIATGARSRIACIAAITLVGQTTALRASRAMFLRLLETDTLTDDDLDAVKARIAANTHAILDRLIAERQDLP